MIAKPSNLSRRAASGARAAAGIMVWTLGMLVSSPPLLAQTVAPAPETQKTAAALLAVERHWTRAEVRGDVAYLQALLAPAYESVSANGVAHPRSVIIAGAVRNGRSDAMARTVATYMKLHPFSSSVTIEGDTGIVTFYSRTLGPLRGVMSSDVFSYSNGRWHAIYSQHTAVQP